MNFNLRPQPGQHSGKAKTCPFCGRPALYAARYAYSEMFVHALALGREGQQITDHCTAVQDKDIFPGAQISLASGLDR